MKTDQYKRSGHNRLLLTVSREMITWAAKPAPIDDRLRVREPESRREDSPLPEVRPGVTGGRSGGAGGAIDESDEDRFDIAIARLTIELIRRISLKDTRRTRG